MSSAQHRYQMKIFRSSSVAPEVIPGHYHRLNMTTTPGYEEEFEKLHKLAVYLK